MTAFTAPAPETSLQVSHASGLHAVNRMLAAMHREMLRAGGIEGGAVRLSVLNLVAACVSVESADLATQAVGHIGAKHPARAIVVVADPDGEAGIEADLTLQCARAGEGQICTEQVRLQVSGEPAYHLASVITPLLVPDVPVVLWLVGSPPVQQAFGLDAVTICEGMIIDSGAYPDAPATLATLAAEAGALGDAVPLCDVAWERSRPWRRMIANAFDGAEIRPLLHGIESVDIDCGGAAVPAQAWLLAGWMASRLGWAGDTPTVRTRSQPDDDDDDHDLRRVALRCRARGRQATITVTRMDDTLVAVIDVVDGLHAERAVRHVAANTVELVAGMLENLAEDPVYRAALERGAAFAADAAR